MREIKFRAWDNDKMIDVKILEYVPEHKSFSGKAGYNINYHLGIPAENLMQYTGPKDKNGKEIYEGDILIDEIERIFVIISMLGGLSVLPVKYYHDKIGNELIAQPTNDSQVYSALCNFKIIGNIYQNPELLEKP